MAAQDEGWGWEEHEQGETRSPLAGCESPRRGSVDFAGSVASNAHPGERLPNDRQHRIAGQRQDLTGWKRVSLSAANPSRRLDDAAFSLPQHQRCIVQMASFPGGTPFACLQEPPARNSASRQHARERAGQGHGKGLHLKLEAADSRRTAGGERSGAIRTWRCKRRSAAGLGSREMLLGTSITI
ncbi:hypothetical protein EG329_007953 [Mollisiaceae sp. DMI_Dod_QoI]|nr:hypothetical protein EG329_007953 [Helotiales sp. DMI_Dod_QoI]